MSQIQVLSREELYELVWSNPMSTLSKEFGLSDKGLAKKCKKHKIPTPPLGYWSKVRSGRKALKAKLPKNNEPSLDKVIFYPKSSRSSPSIESKACLDDKEIDRASHYIFPKRVNTYHSLIMGARKIPKGNVDKYGRLHWFSLKVTPGQMSRTCLFLEGLVRLFKTYGWELENKEPTYQQHGKYLFSDGREGISFEIIESVRRIPHEKRDTDSKFWTLKYDYQPIGVLILRIDNIYNAGFKTAWKDTKTKLLEMQVVSIVESFSQAFDFKRLEAIHKEEEKQKWSEEETKRKELLRLERVERARLDNLLKVTSNFQSAQSIYALINALRSADVNTAELNAWLYWAEKIAQNLDPVRNVDEILKTHQNLSKEQFST